MSPAPAATACTRPGSGDGQQAAGGDLYQLPRPAKADLHKRTSHPILNGELPCSSCHNPHQSQNEASLKQPSLNESCYECHAEKRGPSCGNTSR